MKLELPNARAAIYSIQVYCSQGVLDMEQIVELKTVEIPDDTYLVILRAKNTVGRIVSSWGFDRIQWLAYKPEYHNPKRLAPKKQTTNYPTGWIHPNTIIETSVDERDKPIAADAAGENKNESPGL